jgi:hypothetical protein
LQNFVFVLGESRSALMPIIPEALELPSKTPPQISNLQTLDLANIIADVFTNGASVPEPVTFYSVHEYIKRSQMLNDPIAPAEPYCFVITSFRCNDGTIATRPSTLMPIYENESFKIGDTKKMYLKFAVLFDRMLPLYELDGYAEDSIYHDLVKFCQLRKNIQ